MKTAIGLLAGALTSFAWLPQIIRIYRSKHAADISWGYLIVIDLGISFWCLYGVLTSSLPVIVANGVSDVFVLWVIAKKFQLSRPRWQQVHPGPS